MKTGVEGARPGGEVDRVVARSRGKQLWLVVAILALVAIGFAGFKLNVPKPIAMPKITYISAGSPGAGMVTQLLVRPGEHVRRGELLAVLDFSHLQAEQEAAFNNLIAVAEQNPAGGPTLAAPLPPPGLTGNLEKRAVPIIQPATALPPVGKTPPAVNVPASSAPTPNSNVEQLQKQIAMTQTASDGLAKQITALQQNVSADQDAVTSSQALVDSLNATVTRSKADADKASTLLAEGVLSANDATKAQGYALQAEGRLQEAKVAAAQAVATLGDTQRSLDSANQTAASDQSQIKKLQAQLTEAKKHPKSTTVESVPPIPTTPLASPPVKFRLEPVKGSTGPKGPAAPLSVNFITPAQIILQVQKAQHQLNVIDSSFTSVCVFAPSDGTVIQVPARSGQMVSRGTVLVQIRR